MMPADQPVRIAGEGPSGALLAILLERRGFRVELYEARPDPRDGAGDSGRSINLALADRGIHALREAGVFAEIAPGLVPMRGRMIHALDGSLSFQPYGQRAAEVIYSISRHRLNQALLRVAARAPGVSLRFRHRLEGADFGRRSATFRDLAADRTVEVPMRPLLGCDGAGSRLRRRMTEDGLIETREQPLDHGYKELTIPPDALGGHRLEREALHVWPRGEFMLIALPNEDGSFTATLFLPMRGPVSFAALGEGPAASDFLRANFPDVIDAMPDLDAEFRTHPVGSLGTVYCSAWHSGAAAALVGDAAHAIVPFHGQGMNCCFEDCVEFDALLARHSSWEALFADFFAARKANTDAIAAMAIENYLEMRARVNDPKFRLQQALALELERLHPLRFIPRYAMVMFHHEIGYRTALERGLVQSRLLVEATRTADTLQEVDFELAGRAVLRDLPPLAAPAPA